MGSMRRAAAESNLAESKKASQRPKMSAGQPALRIKNPRTRGQPSRLMNVDLVEAGSTATRKRQKASAARAIANMVIVAQEEEKRRIAMDLHDDVGQTLSTIKFALQGLVEASGSQSIPQLKSRLTDLVEIAQTAIDSVYRIATDLRPAMLDQLGFVPTCRWMLRQFCIARKEIGIDVKLAVKEKDISGALKITLFRIVQEALNNVAKHSKADCVNVRLRKEKNRLLLIIEDNGVGYDEADLDRKRANRPGRGLANMIYRAVQSGGHCAIESKKGRGTRVVASWPLRPNSA